eukprot:TRINITY_DN8600_c0_g1_i5.p1 TRINITY_DN8600_c0_g1~~TRINITY_DN8600_c0_g1_i5.p1  ORF type:complete len:269 (-),score=59.89 TRINITY_DN8600_c0_g1_i5:27-833(-)
MDRDPRLIVSIVPHLRALSLRHGESLYTQESFAEEVFFVKSGTLGIYNDREAILSTFSPGDVVGLREILSRELKRTHRIRAKTDVILYSLPADIFRGVLQSFEDVRYEIEEMNRIQTEKETILTRAIAREDTMVMGSGFIVGPVNALYFVPKRMYAAALEGRSMKRLVPERRMKMPLVTLLHLKRLIQRRRLTSTLIPNVDPSIESLLGRLKNIQIDSDCSSTETNRKRARRLIRKTKQVKELVRSVLDKQAFLLTKMEGLLETRHGR